MVRQQALVHRAWAELEPEIAKQGFELVEVEVGQYGATPVLRLYVDREGGVTIDDCARLSRFLSPYLDLMEFMEDQYTLEVSSPGIDRPVRKPKDFERFRGEPVRVKTLAPVEGRKRFKGVLTGFEDGMIAIESEGHVHRIHIENVHKAQLDR